MPTITIDLPDAQAAAAQAAASAQGLTLEGWIKQVLAKEAPSRPRYTLEQLVAECDPGAALTDEDHGWLDSPPVGREAL